MQTGIIVQARTGSTRLPNKVLLPFYEGKGILELTITKLRNNSKLPIVIATSKNSSDEKIIQLAKKSCVEFFSGSEKNVLERFIDAAVVLQVHVLVGVIVTLSRRSSDSIGR